MTDPDYAGPNNNDIYRNAVPSSRLLTREDQLKLDIFDQIPFTIWACSADYKIVFWNNFCKEKYGIPAHDALGRDFVELFVDDLEKDDARVDCQAIIEEGKRFRNHLTYDRSKDGSTISILTNCFRVFDEKLKQYLQVEVGVSADELDLERERVRLHSLRELAKNRREERARATAALRDSMTDSMTDHFDLQIHLLEAAIAKLEDAKAEAETSSSNRRLLQQCEQKILDKKNEIKGHRAMKRARIQKIREAPALDELVKLQEEWDDQ